MFCVHFHSKQKQNVEQSPDFDRKSNLKELKTIVIYMKLFKG